jgi:hypothetical protein
MFWLGLIVSLCYVPGVTGAHIATQWPVLSVLLPLALWRSGSMTVLHWLGVAFLTYAAARIASAPLVFDAVFGFWLLCIMALSFWLGSTLHDLRGLYKGLALGVSVSSVIAVLQYFGLSPVPYASSNPAGLFINSVSLGLISALLIVALASERMWLLVLPLLPGLMLSGSRGAWLALAIGLWATIFRSAWVLAAVGFAGVFFLFTLQPSSSDETRLIIWTAAANNLTWLGWGPGAFYSWVVPFRGSLLYPEYAHNDALQLAFEYGVAAVLPIGIFGCLLTRTNESEWPLFVAFAVAGCYSMPLWVPVASFLVCVAAGRGARGWALARRDRRNSRLYELSRRPHDKETGYGRVSMVANHQTGS